MVCRWVDTARQNAHRTSHRFAPGDEPPPHENLARVPFEDRHPSASDVTIRVSAGQGSLIVIGAGAAICCIIPHASNSFHASMILPFFQRMRMSAVNLTGLPVGAMPIASPV